MLSIFTCPKPFTDPHIRIIQRNALTSWTHLVPRPEIFVIGEEEGTAQICDELDLSHEPRVARNEFDTPLLDDVMRLVHQSAAHRLLAYVNADIILTGDLMEAIQNLDAAADAFVGVGGRVNLAIDGPLRFDQDDWEERLRVLARSAGPAMREGVDIFVFPKGVFEEVPPFAIGRTVFDNWLLWSARHRRIPLVDFTPSVLTIHQNHASSNTWTEIVNGPEARRNRSLTTEWRHSFTLDDASHQLVEGRVHRRLRAAWANRVKVLGGTVPSRSKLVARTLLGSRAYGGLKTLKGVVMRGKRSARP